MGPGEILFQDDVKNSPAKKTPTHQSGVVGDFPCQVCPDVVPAARLCLQPIQLQRDLLLRGACVLLRSK